MALRKLIPRSLRNWFRRSLAGPSRWWSVARLDFEKHPLERPYTQHAWIYACVRSIASNIASVPFKLYTGDTRNPQLIEEGPLYSIFNRPNPQWSRYHLWEATVVHLELTGNALWVLDRERPNQVPAEIWVIRKDFFEPIFKKGSRELIGWNFRRSSNETIRLDPCQVIHFKLFNPYNDFWGIGPIEAARLSAEQDYLAAQYNRAFFENSADPGGILTVEGELTPTQREQLRAQWESRYKGPKRAFRLAILEGGMDYKQLSVSHKDMLFIEQRKWTRDEVLAVFKVPKAEVSVYEDINYATARTADKNYWVKTLIPLMNLIEDTLRAQFFLPYDEERTWGEFDLSVVESLQEDYAQKIDQAYKLFQMGYPVNAINEKLELGMPEVPWGNDGYLPMNLLEVGTAKEPEKAILQPEPSHIEVLTRSLPHTEEQRRFWEEYISGFTRYEQKFSRRIRTYLMRMRKYFEEIFKKAPELAEDLPFDALDLGPEWEQEIQALADTFLRELAEAEKPRIEKTIQNAGYMFSFDPNHPQLRAFIEKKKIKIVRVPQTIRERVREAHIAAVEKGETVHELANRVYKIMQDSRHRSLRIARTETGQATNGLLYESERMAGVKKHLWLAALDEVTRETHIENMQAGPWPVGKPFPANGLRYPGDIAGPAGEVVNCRCTLVPQP